MEIVHGLRKACPDIAITTDMIVGFCDESEEEFQNSINLYKEADFDFCYISRYSTRKGTFAAKNLEDNITKEEKAKRWHELNIMMKEITQKKLEKYIGKIVEVLVEEFEPAVDPANSIYRGKSEHLKNVQFTAPESPAKPNLKGTLQKIRIDRAESWMLFGEIV